MSKSKRLQALNDMRAAASESVHIGYVHGDQVDAHFANALFELGRVDAATKQRIKSRVSIGSGPRIASARNNIVRSFLKSDAQWLLNLDTDIIFPPNLLDELFKAAEAADSKFVSGLYFLGGKDAHITPCMYLRREGHWGVNPVIDWPAGNVVAVDAVGAGCMLIHRDVLEAVGEQWESKTAYPWFAETEHNGHEFGEDITFCFRVRALGLPIYVHTGLVLHHRKCHLLNVDEYRMQVAREEAGTQKEYEDSHLRALGAVA